MTARKSTKVARENLEIRLTALITELAGSEQAAKNKTRRIIGKAAKLLSRACKIPKTEKKKSRKVDAQKKQPASKKQEAVA